MGILPACLVFLALAGQWLQTAPAITSPREGEVLRGLVEVQGDLGKTTFTSAELAFAFAGDPTGTWFRLQNLPADTPAGMLAVWDTPQLTDGDYRLRLKLILTDGTVQELLVENLHIRNDVPAAAATEPISEGTFEPVDEVLEPASPSPTPGKPPETVLPGAPLPANPAEIGSGMVYSVFGRGAILTLVLFATLGLLLRLRRP